MVNFLVLVIFIFTSQTPNPIPDPPILANDLEVNYPESATFRLEIDPEFPLVDAVLTYQVGANSCLSAGTQVPVEVDGSELSWTWVMSRSGNPPPGAQMWWAWTLTDTSGNSFTTPRIEYTFTDDRFEWRTIEAGGDGELAPIKLNWYEGDQVGPILLDAAEAGLTRLQDEMGITLEDEVEIFIYASSADMREALLYIQDWAGGVAFSEYNTVLIGVPPHLADSWGADTVRHELAHLVVDQFGQSCVGGGRPTWLNEGLAMYAEGEPSDTILEDLELGLQTNSFEPVRSLNGPFPAQGDAASSAYSQSYSLINFLLEEYGREKIQSLLLTLADGASYDGALEEVYGFNADGLEIAWRSAVGAAPRAIPPTPTPILAAAVPTVVPLGAAEGWPTPNPQLETSGSSLPQLETSGSSPIPTPISDSNTSGLCGLALMPLMVVLSMAGFGRWRRKIKGAITGDQE